MHALDTLCPCNPCRGSACTCGCQEAHAGPQAAAAVACACAPRCACDTAEPGCLCRGVPASA